MFFHGPFSLAGYKITDQKNGSNGDAGRLLTGLRSSASLPARGRYAKLFIYPDASYLKTKERREYKSHTPGRYFLKKFTLPY